MLYKKDSASKFTIEGGTEGLLYPPSPKGDQSVAVVDLDGVYPAKGYSINDFCTETLCVIEGTLELECDDNLYNLFPGDLFFVLPNHRYRLKGKGKTFVFISPAWDSSQNHIIE